MAPRGADAEQAVTDSTVALDRLGGRVRAVVGVLLSDLPGEAQVRKVVVVEKWAVTPPQYPRRVGVPAKRPLGAMRRAIGERGDDA